MKTPFPLLLPIAALLIVAAGCQVKTPEQKEDAKSTPAVSPVATPPAEAVSSLLPPFVASNYANKVVLLDIWAPWNAQSLAELPMLKKLQSDLQAQPFTVVGLAVERADQAAAVEKIRGLDLPYPVSFARDDLLKTYGGVRAVPTRVLLDKKGAVRKQYAGLTPESKIREDIAALLGEP